MERPREEDEQDRRLVEAFLAERSDAAFRRLYRCHTPRMLRLAIVLAPAGPGSPEDVVQEAWIRAVAGLRGFAWRWSLPSWLGGVVVNVAREFRRSAAARLPGASGSSESRESEPMENRDPTVFLSLAALLAELPEGYRAVFLLHDLDGFTHAEIGQMLGIDPGTSKSQLARARQRLREGLGNDQEGNGHAAPAL